MRVPVDYSEGRVNSLYSQQLCDRPLQLPAEPQDESCFEKPDLQDMDSYIEDENPFETAGNEADQITELPKSKRTPYFESSDVAKLGCKARSEEVIKAATSGLLHGCGVSRAGITMYPEMLRDISKSAASFARTRAETARSCVWFWIVDLDQ